MEISRWDTARCLLRKREDSGLCTYAPRQCIGKGPGIVVSQCGYAMSAPATNAIHGDEGTLNDSDHYLLGMLGYFHFFPQPHDLGTWY